MDSRAGKARIVGKHFIIFIACCVLFAPYYTAYSESTPQKGTAKEKRALLQKHLRQGKLAYKKKDYQKALSEWNAGLNLNPHHKELQENVLKAEEKISTGPEETKKSHTLSNTKKSRLIEKKIREAKLAYRKKNYEPALQAVKEGLMHDKNNHELNELLLKLKENVDEEIFDSIMPSLPIPEEKADRLESELISTPSDIATTPLKKLAPEGELEYDYWSNQNYDQLEMLLPYDGIPLTLEQTIMIARANSLSVRIARDEAALARWKVAPARRARYPSFDLLWKETSGTTTGQDFEGREITFEFQKPLITWGKTKALHLQAKINWEIAKRNLQKEVTELDFKTEQAFFILANALQEAKDLKELFEGTKEDMVRAQKRNEKELSRPLELLKSRSKVDEIYYRMKSAEKDLILAELTMRQILNSHLNEPFTLKSFLGPYDLQTTLEQCIDLALRSRSDLFVNELLVEYNKLGRKVAKSAKKFNVNLEGSVGVNDEAFVSESLDLNNEYFIGVKVTKPFGGSTGEVNFLTQDKVPSVGQTTSTEFTSITAKYYFWNNTAKIDIAEADIKFLKSIDEYIKKRNSVVFEIKKNFYEFLKAQQQLENNLQKINVAEVELKIAQARLHLNEILDSELLDAKDRLSRSKAEYGQALTGYYTSVANINKSIGITDYFDLKRGIRNNQASSTSSTWQAYINEGGVVSGPVIGLESYERYIQKMERKKPWYQWWRNDLESDEYARKRSSYMRTIQKSDKKKRNTTSKKVNVLYNEGLSLYEQGDYQGAKDKFETARSLDPELSKINRQLDRTNESLGLQVEHEEVPASNFASTKSEFDLIFDEGLAAYHQGDYQQAIYTLEKAQVLNPNDRRAKIYIKRSQKKLEKSK